LRTFSVIVPTFNRAHLLPRCIESVCRQTFEDFELIVADDGSTDDTREVVERLAGADPRIRYTYQENKGAGDARNLGASLARGQLLTFLDSDDEVLPEWLSRFREAFCHSDVAVVCCGCRFINRNGEQTHVRLPIEQGSAPLHQWGFFFTGTYALRCDVFSAVGGFASGLPANQHSELRLRLLPFCRMNSWLVSCIGEPLVIRYSHDGGNIRSNVGAIYESGTFILNQHGDLLREYPPSFSAWAAAVGGSAARLRKYREARTWFVRAVRFCPYRWKNYARLALACVPGVRSLVWRGGGTR